MAPAAEAWHLNHWTAWEVPVSIFFHGFLPPPQSCLQRIHRGLVFYEKLLGSDIFTGEPSLLPDGPVDQLHASVLGLRELLQV